MKKSILTLVIVLSLTMLAACGTQPATGQDIQVSPPGPASGEDSGTALDQQIETTPEGEAQDMILVPGTIKEITPKEDAQVENVFDILLLADDGQEIIFHCHPDYTTFTVPVADLKVDTKLTVEYNGVLTRSIPGQGTASQLLPYETPPAVS